ncbi:DUF6126 family protein [Streptomyces sp. TRM 70351]|nr:DUF6126 family protein [Streptomyces sp. TRM 70351]MEE1928102.1 DUF6126 family protein [Streptomyces sp. TRM 70351]
MGVTGGGTERWKERRVLLRVLIYVVATHVFAFFVILLFQLGDRSG